MKLTLIGSVALCMRMCKIKKIHLYLLLQLTSNIILANAELAILSKLATESDRKYGAER